MEAPIAANEHEDVPPEVASITRYFLAMEQRVKSLEAQVARLCDPTADQSETGSFMPGFPRQSTSADAILTPLKLNREEFKLPDHSEDKIHAIELLVDNGTVLCIRIRSEQMLKIFQDIMDPDLAPIPPVTPSKAKSVVMTQPFKALMIYRGHLDKRRDYLEKSSITVTDDVISPVLYENRCLESLLETLDTEMSQDFSAYSKLRERSTGTVYFQHLWYLFQPGDIIAEGSGKSTQAYRILNVRESNLQDGESNPFDKAVGNIFTLDCFSIGFDGNAFGPVQTSFHIMHFFGPRRIFNLPIFPIQYHDTVEQLHLTKRGKLFHSLRKPSHRSYTGLSRDQNQIAHEIDGEVMVDVELYYRENPDKAPKIGLAEPVENRGDLGQGQTSGVYDDSKVDRHLTEEFLREHPEILEVNLCDAISDIHTLPQSQLMLLPSLLWAFYLRDRKWHVIDVNMVRDVRWPERAFHYLVLPEDQKELLSSLVKVHGNRSHEYIGHIDLVSGKGQGLIVLLHGGPGVGKTSTAECLAAYAQKPLLPITPADMGDAAGDTERHLENFFTLSQRWGCILLLDEADILLQARDRTNLQRNAIVSVFLRVLEYYSGILIMTTNRVGTFDEAIKSRIHVVLYYPSLTKKSCMKLWDMSLRRVSDESKSEGKTSISRIDVSAMLDFLSHWLEKQQESPGKLPNGRDIRNTLQSAVALAESQHEPLSARHLEVILGMSSNFDKYMSAIHGGTDDVLARRSGDRNDDYWDRPRTSNRAAYPKPLYTTSRQSEKLLESSPQR